MVTLKKSKFAQRVNPINTSKDLNGTQKTIVPKFIAKVKAKKLEESNTKRIIENLLKGTGAKLTKINDTYFADPITYAERERNGEDKDFKQFTPVKVIIKDGKVTVEKYERYKSYYKKSDDSRKEDYKVYLKEKVTYDSKTGNPIKSQKWDKYRTNYKVTDDYKKKEYDTYLAEDINYQTKTGTTWKRSNASRNDRRTVLVAPKGEIIKSIVDGNKRTVIYDSGDAIQYEGSNIVGQGKQDLKKAISSGKYKNVSKDAVEKEFAFKHIQKKLENKQKLNSNEKFMLITGEKPSIENLNKVISGRTDTNLQNIRPNLDIVNQYNKSLDKERAKTIVQSTTVDKPIVSDRISYQDYVDAGVIQGAYVEGEKIADKLNNDFRFKEVNEYILNKKKMIEKNYSELKKKGFVEKQTLKWMETYNWSDRLKQKEMLKNATKEQKLAIFAMSPTEHVFDYNKDGKVNLKDAKAIFSEKVDRGFLTGTSPKFSYKEQENIIKDIGKTIKTIPGIATIAYGAPSMKVAGTTDILNRIGVIDAIQNEIANKKVEKIDSLLNNSLTKTEKETYKKKELLEMKGGLSELIGSGKKEYVQSPLDKQVLKNINKKLYEKGYSEGLINRFFDEVVDGVQYAMYNPWETYMLGEVINKGSAVVKGVSQQPIALINKITSDKLIKNKVLRNTIYKPTVFASNIAQKGVNLAVPSAIIIPQMYNEFKETFENTGDLKYSRDKAIAVASANLVDISALKKIPEVAQFANFKIKQLNTKIEPDNKGGYNLIRDDFEEPIPFRKEEIEKITEMFKEPKFKKYINKKGQFEVGKKDEKEVNKVLLQMNIKGMPKVDSFDILEKMYPKAKKEFLQEIKKELILNKKLILGGSTPTTMVSKLDIDKIPSDLDLVVKKASGFGQYSLPEWEGYKIAKRLQERGYLESVDERNINVLEKLKKEQELSKSEINKERIKRFLKLSDDKLKINDGKFDKYMNSRKGGVFLKEYLKKNNDLLLFGKSSEMISKTNDFDIINLKKDSKKRIKEIETFLKDKGMNVKAEIYTKGKSKIYQILDLDNIQKTSKGKKYYEPLIEMKDSEKEYRKGILHDGILISSRRSTVLSKIESLNKKENFKRWQKDLDELNRILKTDYKLSGEKGSSPNIEIKGIKPIGDFIEQKGVLGVAQRFNPAKWQEMVTHNEQMRGVEFRFKKDVTGSENNKVELHTEEWIKAFPFKKNRIVVNTPEGKIQYIDFREQLIRKLYGGYDGLRTKDIINLKQLEDSFTKFYANKKNIPKFDDLKRFININKKLMKNKKGQANLKTKKKILNSKEKELVSKYNLDTKRYARINKYDINKYAEYSKYNKYNKYVPYSKYPSYDKYDKYQPYKGYTPYKPYVPYSPYTPYTPYTPYKPYVPYSPYTPYTPYTPYQPYTPYTPTKKSTKIKPPFLKFDGKKEYTNFKVDFKRNNEIIASKVYATKKDAINAGANVTDKMDGKFGVEEFKISPITQPIKSNNVFRLEGKINKFKYDSLKKSFIERKNFRNDNIQKGGSQKNNKRGNSELFWRLIKSIKSSSS